MCLLVYSPAGPPPETALANGLAKNGDSWGYMFPAAGKLVIRRGLWNNNFWELWEKDLPAIGTAPVVWHARWATHGRISHDNCHPVRLHKKHGDVAIAHNGIIDCVPRSKKASDTVMFARHVLDELAPGFLSNPDVFALLERLIDGSKITVMDGTGKVWLLNEGHGIWDKEVWYSNTDYLPPPPKPAGGQWLSDIYRRHTTPSHSAWTPEELSCVRQASGVTDFGRDPEDDPDSWADHFTPGELAELGLDSWGDPLLNDDGYPIDGHQT